jgi:hypothetical protein
VSEDGDERGATATVERDSCEVRFAQDEERLGRDEQPFAEHVQRLAEDEQRLALDEDRLELEEHAAHVNRRLAWFSVALVGVFAIAVGSLVIAVVALRHDVRTLANAASDNSVATSAIQDGAVTAPKLAGGAVTSSALGPRAVGRASLAPHAVGLQQLAPNAMTGQSVRRNSLTGADVREGTLGPVPSAQAASRARLAGDSAALGGLSSAAYLSGIGVVRTSTSADTRSAKGPLSAQCPSDMRVISGGAEIVGADRGVALVRSAPNGGHAWTASAAAYRGSRPPWRLVVSTVCAAGGR